MSTACSYTEVASADGSWLFPLQLPLTPVEKVRNVLAHFARDTGWPVTCFAYGDAGEPVEEILLCRDPSKTFGTPSFDECDAAVRALIAATGWEPVPERAPIDGVLVGLGLREGYADRARQHEPAEVVATLAAHGASGRYRAARLMSARLINDSVRWYEEMGVVLHSPVRVLPVITELACEFAQQRFVVTDLAQNRTYVLAQ